MKDAGEGMIEQGVVIYGVGSSLVVEYEESLLRAGIAIVGAVQNVPGQIYLLDQTRLIQLHDRLDDIRSFPYLVPLFTPGNRQKAVQEATIVGFTQPYSLIDTSVVWPRSVAYQPGLYVNSGVTVGAASQYEVFVLINRGASLGHHVQLGRFVSIGPGAVIAGEVIIGHGSVVGAGAVVLPKIKIGANSVIGAGAVVMRDVPDHCLVLGNPARIVKSEIAGYSDLSVL